MKERVRGGGIAGSRLRGRSARTKLGLRGRDAPTVYLSGLGMSPGTSPWRLPSNFWRLAKVFGKIGELAGKPSADRAEPGHLISMGTEQKFHLVMQVCVNQALIQKATLVPSREWHFSS